MAKWKITIDLKKIAKHDYIIDSTIVNTTEEKNSILEQLMDTIEDNKKRSFIMGNQIFLVENIARIRAEKIES